MRGRAGLSVFLFCLLPLSHGGAVNRTIDDRFGDSQTSQMPLFLPPTGGIWADETCVGCAIKPDTSMAFNGTYTAATYHPALNNISISMGFEGTAIYVFFILPNKQGDGVTTITTANFTIDGQIVGAFTHIPDLTTTDILYNQTVFSKTGLPNAVHQLVISTSDVDFSVFVNFDYAIYTHVDADIVPSTISPTTTLSTSIIAQSPSANTVSPATSTLIPNIQTTSSSSQSSSNEQSSSGFTVSLSSNIHSLPTGVSTSSSFSNSASSSTSSFSASNTSNVEADPNFNSKAKPVAAIAGGTVGGIVALCVIIITLLLCRKKRQRQSQSPWSGSKPTNPNFAGAASARAHTPLLDVYPNQDDHHASSTTNDDLFAQQSQQSFAAHQSNFSLSNSPTSVISFDTSAPDSLSVMGTDGGSCLPMSGSVSSAISRDEIRDARQSELEQQMRIAKEEIIALRTGITAQQIPSGNAAMSKMAGGNIEMGSDSEIGRIQEQMRAMQARIDLLRSQQQSAWAQGLSNDPPPGYTP